MIIMPIRRGASFAARARGLARLLLPCLIASVAAAGSTPLAVADGAGSGGLTLRVTVNTRPGLGAQNPGIRVRGPVVKSYRLINRGGADLHGLRVSDPGMPGARIRCPGGGDRVPLLPGLRTVTCTAQAPAQLGSWTAEVVATGRIPYLRATVRATARSGYAGVGGKLSLTQTARVTGPSQAEVRYVLTNTGNRTVYAVTVTDAALASPRTASTRASFTRASFARAAAPRIVCAGGGGPVVGRLTPGTSATCTTTVRRPPGLHVAEGRARGTDRIRTLGRRGESVAPPPLTARSSARFVIPRTPPPASSRPSAPQRPAPSDPSASGAGAPGGSGAPGAPVRPGIPPEVLPGAGAGAPGGAEPPTGVPGLAMPPGGAAVPPGGAVPPGLAVPPGIAFPPGGAVPPGLALPPGPAVPPGLAVPFGFAVPPGPGVPPGLIVPFGLAVPPGFAVPPGLTVPFGLAFPPGFAVPPGLALPPGLAVPEDPAERPEGAVPQNPADQPEQPSAQPDRSAEQRERSAAQRPQDGRAAVSRFLRGERSPTGIGVAVALFLILIPAAVAAAVLGSRRH
ncbi:hypothetical protein [Streptomyces candidus]|uniref:Uncharacterized protein n=1 Tax=Streptomyces candidus TaxID=67283 RepID=A0A7X0HE04_9ACTN|nr:hypothetical protein [Streptomyces candidus]MBB6435791.1 hypothetical protein [Streptomyces candidus]